MSLTSFYFSMLVVHGSSLPFLWSGHKVLSEFDLQESATSSIPTRPPKFPTFDSGFQGIGAATLADIDALSPALANDITEGVINSGLANATASAINGTREALKASAVAVKNAINVTVEAVVTVAKPWYQFILDVQHQIEKGFHYLLIFLDVAVSITVLVFLIIVIRNVYGCFKMIKGVAEEIPLDVLKKTVPYKNLHTQATETIV